jgi:hypothetical protein
VVDPAPDAALLAAYAATRWTVHLPSGRLTLGLAAPAPPPLRPSAVVTACNPASRSVSDQENERADRVLRERIDADRIRWHRTEAQPSGHDAERWREPGYVLLAVDREAAVRLGEDFGQNAIVWIGADGRVSLVATRAGFCGRMPGEEIPVPEMDGDAGPGHAAR